MLFLVDEKKSLLTQVIFIFIQDKIKYLFCCCFFLLREENLFD
jgi:hypothetical protein